MNSICWYVFLEKDPENAEAGYGKLRWKNKPTTTKTDARANSSINRQNSFQWTDVVWQANRQSNILQANTTVYSMKHSPATRWTHTIILFGKKKEKRGKKLFSWQILQNSSFQQIFLRIFKTNTAGWHAKCFENMSEAIIAVRHGKDNIEIIRWKINLIFTLRAFAMCCYAIFHDWDNHMPNRNAWEWRYSFNVALIIQIITLQ